MKKFLALTIITTLLLSGCLLKKQGDKIIEDATNSNNNVKGEITEATDKVVETKNKIDETVDDVQNAFKEIEEAKKEIEEAQSAIEEITK